jgi:hypothetical protein
VIIDLREVGRVVARPVPQALFDADATDGTLRRPSPATVLFLENGGGKTVLMKLIFSVMLPGRRNVLGSSSTRVLEDYVLAEDLAQVAIEWRHTRTGERVVTGKASEWRGHTVSSDPSRLSEMWYTFRPTSSFNLDTMPLTVDGRLLTMAGFRDRLSQAGRAQPRLQAAGETNHREWVTKLENLDLDPELFRYQRAMNAGEGEAADAFTFKNDEAFVDFLLRAVTNEEDPRGLAEVLSGYAAKLAQRGHLLAERDFVAGALELITPLVDAAREATAARELARDARMEPSRRPSTRPRRQPRRTRPHPRWWFCRSVRARSARAGARTAGTSPRRQRRLPAGGGRCRPAAGTASCGGDRVTQPGGMGGHPIGCAHPRDRAAVDGRSR